MGQEPHGIAEGGTAEDGDPERAVRRLEARAEAIRDNLDVLVDEAQRRGSRLVKPIALGTALVVLAAGGVVVWRGLRRRSTPPRLRSVARAWRRMAEHPERVAQARPSLSRKVLASAAAALASIAVHELARVATSKLARTDAWPPDDDTAGA